MVLIALIFAIKLDAPAVAADRAARNRRDNNPYCSEAPAQRKLLWGFAAIFIGTMCCTAINFGVKKIINPEYYAARDVANMIKSQ